MQTRFFCKNLTFFSDACHLWKRPLSSFTPHFTDKKLSKLRLEATSTNYFVRPSSMKGRWSPLAPIGALVWNGQTLNANIPSPIPPNAVNGSHTSAEPFASAIERSWILPNILSCINYHLDHHHQRFWEGDVSHEYLNIIVIKNYPEVAFFYLLLFPSPARSPPNLPIKPTAMFTTILISLTLPTST